MLRILLTALIIASVSLPNGAIAQAKKKRPEVGMVGKEAPEIKPLFALNGDKATLADLKGKVVLLDFWAVWCPPCKVLFPQLRTLHETYGKDGLEVVGLTLYYQTHVFKGGKVVRVKKPISADEEHKMLEDFTSHHKMPYRVQTVSSADLAKYKVAAIPVAFLLDRKGTIRHVRIGATPEGLKELEAKIKELLAEK